MNSLKNGLTFFGCFYDNPMLLVVTSLSILFLLTRSRHFFHLFISNFINQYKFIIIFIYNYYNINAIDINFQFIPAHMTQLSLVIYI